MNKKLSIVALAFAVGAVSCFSYLKLSNNPHEAKIGSKEFVYYFVGKYQNPDSFQQITTCNNGSQIKNIKLTSAFIEYKLEIFTEFDKRNYKTSSFNRAEEELVCMQATGITKI